MPPRIGSLDGEHRSPLSMLPTILYLPKTGGYVHPDREALDQMERCVESLWGLEEDHWLDSSFFREVRPHAYLYCNTQNHFRTSLMTPFRFFTIGHVSCFSQIGIRTNHALPRMTRMLQAAEACPSIRN